MSWSRSKRFATEKSREHQRLSCLLGQTSLSFGGILIAHSPLRRLSGSMPADERLDLPASDMRLQSRAFEVLQSRHELQGSLSVC